MASKYPDPIALGLVVKQHILDRSQPGELVGDVRGKDCIVIDKLVDTASTLLDTAQLLKAHGARSVTAFAVHGRFSQDAIDRIDACRALDRLIITDTITPTPELIAYRNAGGMKIDSLTVAPILAETISRIHQKASVSDACLHTVPVKSQ